MISLTCTAEKFQSGAGLSGYIAEIGSALICADLGIVPELEPRPDHASYVESWLQVLQGDKRAVFQAAAHAQRAAAFLHGLQPTEAAEREAA